MKDILLISIQNQTSVSRDKFPAPPMGLINLATYIEKFNFNAKILDLFVRDNLVKKIIQSIEDNKPKFIGFSFSTCQKEIVLKLIRKIKIKFPDLIILAGGPHPTIDNSIIKEGIDIIINGEGEKTLLEILETIKIKKDFKKLKQIKGITYLDKGIKINQKRELIDINEIPKPNRDLVNMKKYEALPNYTKGEKLVHVITSRGCPFNCTFCSNIHGKKFRQRKVDLVIEEIKECKKKYGIKEVMFFDDNFTTNKKWISEFCKKIKKERIYWSCFSRIDTINKDMLNEMKAAGCWNIFYGIEAGYNKALKNISKGINVDLIRETVNVTKGIGIEIRASFILGYPKETKEEAIKTINFAKSLNIDYAQFNLLSPFMKSEIYNEARKEGYFNETEKFDVWNTAYINNNMTEKELKKLQKRGFREFYFRPKYLLKRLLMIKNYKDLKNNINGLRYLIR